MSAAVPTFYLYGEPHRRVEAGFVHAESLDVRSRPGGWTIRPHAHADLAQILFIATGGGTMAVEHRRIAFAAPCLLLVPATTVHGFDWEHETRGTVVTVATRRLAGATRHAPEAAALLERCAAIPLAAGDVERVEGHLTDLARELGWSAPGHDAAVQAALLAILVLALRLLPPADARALAPSRHRTTVARLRARVEQRFRLREPVATYADALGLSETALRAACARVAGTSPAAMLDDRALTEARRALLFSSLSVAEIGYALGFQDPAYFSRFFTRHVGASPRAYRRANSGERRTRADSAGCG